MKLSLSPAIVMALCLSSCVIHASRGGRDDRGDRSDRDTRTPARGTAAWFVHETAENEIRGLLGLRRMTESEPIAVSVRLSSAVTSDVTVTLSNLSIADRCQMQDHSSRSGTIIKKEVYCGNNVYYGPEIRPSRGSNAWALAEAGEHSIRQAVLASPALTATLTGFDATLNSARQVVVSLFAGENSAGTFVCSASNSLHCIAQ